MRITFVLPWAGLAGGVRVVGEHARRLERRGHHVTVISLPWPRFTLTQRLRSFLHGGGLLREPPGGSHLCGLPLDHRVLDHPGPVTDADVPDGDVVVATWWETAEWVASLSPSKGAKVHFIQGYDAVSYEDVWPETVQRVLAGFALPLEKVVVSQWLVDMVRPWASGQPITCVANSVDREQFFAPPREKQSIPTFGFMHSEAPYKGCDVVLAAIEKLRPSLAKMRLLSFGANKPKRLRPPAGCEFVLLPPQPKLREIYSACDAWLFASRKEGFGLPILEAMACRTPVIATPAGAAPQLLSRGGGVLVGMDDAVGMAAAMLQVAHMPATQWRLMSQHAYETVADYTWEHATALFESALRAAAGRAGRDLVPATAEPEVDR